MSSITPSEGSTSGGLHVTIHGFGFGSNRDKVKVFLGNSSCLVNRVNMTTIECTSGEHVALTVYVKVNFSICFIISLMITIRLYDHGENLWKL